MTTMLPPYRISFLRHPPTSISTQVRVGHLTVEYYGKRQLDTLQPAHMAVNPFQVAFASCFIKNNTGVWVILPHQQSAFESYSSLFLSCLTWDS